MKLIDANRLIDEVLALPNCYNGYSDTYDKSLIIGLIDEQIVVDAVPVVRCKDCQYGNTEIQTWVEGAFKDYILCEYYYHPCINKVGDYCSHGERRNDER